MALEKGFIYKFPDRAPPKSTAGFEWPSTHKVTDEQRLAFRKWFTSQLRARDMNHRSFGRQFNGETKDGNGYVIPRGGSTAVMNYLDGTGWPSEERARNLGAFFKTALEDMLVDDGKPLEPIPLVS